MPRKSWKKYRDGDVSYFKHANSAEGYEAALREWHVELEKTKDSRPFSAEYRHHISVLHKCGEWYDRFGVPEEEDDLREIVTELHNRLESAIELDELAPVASFLPNAVTDSEREFIFTFCNHGILGRDQQSTPFNNRFGSVGWSLNGPWEERFRQLDELSSHQLKRPQTVEHQVQRFWNSRRYRFTGASSKHEHGEPWRTRFSFSSLGSSRERTLGQLMERRSLVFMSRS